MQREKSLKVILYVKKFFISASTISKSFCFSSTDPLNYLSNCLFCSSHLRLRKSLRELDISALERKKNWGEGVTKVF